MSHRLPQKGLWQIADGSADWLGDGGHRADAAPFDLIKLDLRGRDAGSAIGAKGTVRARNLETRLGRIRLTAPDRFAAVYEIRGNRGTVEGAVRPDGSLRLELSGTVTGIFVARAACALGDAEPPMGELSAPVRALAGAVESLRRSAGIARMAAA